MQGWIKLHRKIQLHPIWNSSEPFDRRSAWTDLMLQANHDGARFLLGNEWVEVERGSFITSKRKLSERWKWSNTKVDAFLTLLENEKMITVKSDTKKTLVTIEKYEFYQCQDVTETTRKRHENDAETTRKRTNKNDKNDKNEKNEKKKEKNMYAEFVSMTESEYQTLLSEFGVADTNRLIEILNNYKGSKGKTYKSDYMAIRNWVVNRLQEEKQKQKGKGKGVMVDNLPASVQRQIEREQQGRSPTGPTKTVQDDPELSKLLDGLRQKQAEVR